VADPLRAGTIYAGIPRAGAFRSRDGGASWQLLGDGLPVDRFDGKAALAVHGHRTLYAATSGAGVYSLDLP
jgi:hypothetical protein